MGFLFLLCIYTKRDKKLKWPMCSWSLVQTAGNLNSCTAPTVHSNEDYLFQHFLHLLAAVILAPFYNGRYHLGTSVQEKRFKCILMNHMGYESYAVSIFMYTVHIGMYRTYLMMMVASCLDPLLFFVI